VEIRVAGTEGWIAFGCDDQGQVEDMTLRPGTYGPMRLPLWDLGFLLGQPVVSLRSREPHILDDCGRQARREARDLIVPSVLAALAVVIPLGLGGAVSPVMLTEQTVLLAGPDGGRAGVRYAAGVVLTTFVIVVAVVLFGRAISLPTKPHLDASLDLVLGLVLVTMAVLVFVLGRHRGGSPGRKGGDDRRPTSGSHQARAAFPFGVFSMATNVTTLALIAAAAREISRADAEIAAVAVLVLVLVGLVSMPAWVPLALTRAAPGSSQRAFAALRDQIARRGRGFTVGLLGAAGLFFIGRGLIRLLG
jgi:Sap, sulfolipid-1-addressing protein